MAPHCMRSDLLGTTDALLKGVLFLHSRTWQTFFPLFIINALVKSSFNEISDVDNSYINVKSVLMNSNYIQEQSDSNDEVCYYSASRIVDIA